MKHRDVLSKMTVEEKAAFLSGASEWESREIKRLGIPSIYFADGPHGIRKQEGAGDHLGMNPSVQATCFPTAATIANSWNVQLGEAIGSALGKEAAALGVDVLLGPGLNIKRSPLCGRNFEYFSEDPYLSGKMAAAYIQGIQAQGVYACPKHFAVNSQESRRMAMNSVLDERTLREIYLTGFEIAIGEGRAKALMTSYNEINGTYANENEHLLNEILRKEWVFDGIVVTDWGGSNDHVKGVKCRSNVEMPAPGLDSARELLNALDEGVLSIEELDLCVDDFLDAVLTLEEKRKTDQGLGFDIAAHHELAKKAAAESIVLLKNEVDPQPLLPLKGNCRVALIGDFAHAPRYQGAGSSLVNPTKVENMEEMIKTYPLDCLGYAAGYRRTGEADEGMKKEALLLAQTADVVIYCFGLDELSEAEGMDRKHMKIPQNQSDLLEALAGVNQNIIGILSSGSVVEMPWQCWCKSILHGYLGGQGSAGAMLEVLIGRINPSGRLSETYPLRYEDTPAFENFPSTQRNSEYRESIFVGYRFYDTTGVPVQYPFGFGLSYTEFTYSDLNVSVAGAEFVIKNSGKSDGAEVVQLYISAPKGNVFRPAKELKGFQKIFLKVGESQRVRIRFDDKAFRYWNTATNNWEIETGEYQIYIGSNIMDIRLQHKLQIEGTTQEYPCDASEMPSYFSGKVKNVPDAEFEKLLGHPLPDQSWLGELSKNDAICQMYYAKSMLARFIYQVLTKIKAKSERKGKPDLNILYIYNLPFRGIAKMTHGAVSMQMVDGIVNVVNGHLFRGLKIIIKGFFSNKKLNKKYEKLLK